MLSEPDPKTVEDQTESKLDPVEGQTNNGWTLAENHAEEPAERGSGEGQPNPELAKSSG